MPNTRVIKPENLDLDFRNLGTVAGSKYVNDSIVGGVAAPTTPPVAPQKMWIWVNSVSKQITHYWSVATQAWVGIATVPPKVVAQIGNPNLVPPAGSPAIGDVVVQTADGTKTGQLQGSYVWDGVAWILQSSFTPVTMLSSPSVRKYYLQNATVDRFVQAETAATIAARGFTAVGPGAAAIPSGLGGYYNSFIIALQAPARAQNTANIAAIYTPPVSYVRHELQVFAGGDCSYGLKLHADSPDNVVEVWVCDPVSGVPQLRLHGNGTSRYGNGDVGITFGLAPDEAPASWNRVWEWVQFLIPESVVTAKKTAAGTIKLAVLGGLANGNGISVDIGGYSMALVGNSKYVVTPVWALDNQINGGLQLSFSGITTGNPYITIAVSANGASGTWPLTSYPTPITTALGNGFRVCIPDITKDCYLSVLGHGNLYNQESRSVELGIVHPNGNVPLGRPRPTQGGPLAKTNCALSGLGAMGAAGYLIPASVLEAKSYTPPNSAVSYINMYLQNTDTGAAYIAGFMVETA